MTALRKNNVFGRAALLAVLIAVVTAPSSYGNGLELIFYGTPAGPEFGIINPDTWALEPIGITEEPDGSIPGPDRQPDSTAIDEVRSRYRGMAYNSNDGQLYAVLRGWRRGGDPDMIVLDPDTGQATKFVVSNTGPIHSGLTFDADSGLFFSTNEIGGDTLGTLDPNSSAGTVRIGGGRTLGTNGGFFGLAINPADGTLYSIGNPGNGLQTLVTIDKTTGTINEEVAVLDDGFFPTAEAMTVYGDSLLVVANNVGSPELVGGSRPYGGIELYRVPLDGSGVELLNADLGQYVDAIEFAFLPGGGGGRALQPGDVNKDGEVGTTDIVQILGAGKFERDVDALWEDGDVNGAPNEAFTVEGGVGPLGDGRVNTGDVIAILSANLFETGQYTAVKPTNGVDGNVTINYDPGSGNVSVSTKEPISSFQVESASGIFTAEAAKGLGGPFDVDSDGKIFKATFGDQFERLSFGNVAQTGLAETFLLDDLTVSGSFGAGGTFGADFELNYIPEPSTLMLLVVSLLIGPLLVRRKELGGRN